LPRDRGAEPCSVVIFGASGDLTQRKLIPALYNLHLDHLLPAGFSVVGVGRREMSDDAFVESMRLATVEHSRREMDDALWAEMAAGFSWVRAGGEAADYRRLAEHLDRLDTERGTQGHRLFYLAVPPSAFPRIVEGLRSAGLHRPGKAGGWSRIVLEKPIGHDLSSAIELNEAVNAVFDEQAVYRIDHYLGKETVQNLLVFRFANSIFEPLWNHNYVDHVQLTVAETIGVEGRGGYFEEAGTTRDMVQNHMFQLLCLTAMEPPVSLDADAIRDEKVKVLRALRPILPEQVVTSSVRAQYAGGVTDGRKMAGYLEEPGVAPDSRTETYVAMRLFLDNWRWAGVPFYLRAGKRMKKRVTEIALRFQDVPHRLFEQSRVPNTLALQIQPDEGIAIKFETKVPGSRPQIQPVCMEFRYGESFEGKPPEAYERLILDALLGDSTLFIRRDEVRASWSYIDSLMEVWQSDCDRKLPQYTSGSWGPDEADALLRGEERAWRNL
jgi:glucose-6-phosphate 1-dehydrogenase